MNKSKINEIKNRVYEAEGLLELLTNRPEITDSILPLVAKRLDEAQSLLKQLPAEPTPEPEPTLEPEPDPEPVYESAPESDSEPEPDPEPQPSIFAKIGAFFKSVFTNIANFFKGIFEAIFG